MFYNIWQIGKSGNFFFQMFVSSLQMRMYKLYTYIFLLLPIPKSLSTVGNVIVTYEKWYKVIRHVYLAC